MSRTAVRQDITGDIGQALDFNAALSALWTSWRDQFDAAQGIPKRSALTIQALKSVLPMLVVCELCDDGAIRIRLSGTRVDDFLGAGLVGRNILDLSPPDQHGRIARVYRNMSTTPCGFIIHEILLLRGEQTIGLDALLLPLADKDGACRFYIGCYCFGMNRYEADVKDIAPIVHRTVESVGYIDIGFGLPPA